MGNSIAVSQDSRSMNKLTSSMHRSFPSEFCSSIKHTSFCYLIYPKFERYCKLAVVTEDGLYLLPAMASGMEKLKLIEPLVKFSDIMNVVFQKEYLDEINPDYFNTNLVGK